MNILQKITNFFKSLKPESVVRILYQSGLPRDNTTKADICRVTLENVQDVCQYEGKKYEKKYRKFIKRGDTGYYAYFDGDWVTRLWITVGPSVIKRTYFPPLRMNAREAYCHFCETDPKARGMNIPASILAKAAEDLKDRVDTFYALVNEDNHASRRVMEKAGFKEAKRFRWFSFLGLNFYKTIQ